MLYKKQDVQEISWVRHSLQHTDKHKKYKKRHLRILDAHTRSHTLTRIYVHIQYTKKSNT